MKQKLEQKRELEGLILWRRSSEIIGIGVASGHTGIDRCLKFVIKNFSEPIQLQDMMDVAGLSRRGFFEAFRKNVGLNPGAVLRHVRIEYAKRLLIEHDLVLKEVAKRCGYRSQNTFCVAFQREMGISPKKFQRRYWLTACRDHRESLIQPVINSLLPPLPPRVERRASILTPRSAVQKNQGTERVR